jgi:hypothetical protein
VVMRVLLPAFPVPYDPSWSEDQSSSQVIHLHHHRLVLLACKMIMNSRTKK